MPNKISRRIERKQAAKQRHVQEIRHLEDDQAEQQRRELYTALARELTVPTAPLPLLHDHTKVPKVMEMLDNGIAKLQEQGKLMLPKFAPSGVLSVLSDYAGDHQKSLFRTYSFFVAESGLFIREFLKQVKSIRRKYGIPTGSEISYKELKPGSAAAKSIQEFAGAARNLFGIVLTLIVDKTLDSIFALESEGGVNKVHSELLNLGIRQFKPATAERLLRISYPFAYLLKLVAIPSRKVYWLPDRDPIMANERAMQEALRVSNMCGLALGDFPERRIEVIGEEHIDHFYLSLIKGKISGMIPKL